MAGDRRPDISIIIPVWREADGIGRLLDHVVALDPDSRCQCIVVDGEPSASTLAAVDRADVITLRAPRGRALQMNAGAAVATGEMLLFLHADTFLAPGAVEDILRVAGDAAYVGGAFRLKFDSNGAAYRIMAALVSLRARWSRLPYGDQGIFLRKSYFRHIGGYAPIPVMEDVELVRRIRRRGDRLCMLDRPVTTSRRRLESEGIARRVIKNGLITVLYTTGVSPKRLTGLYTNGYRDMDDGSNAAG